MKKIYFVVDEEGYIKGGYSESPLVGSGVRSTYVDESHEIFHSDAEAFKYVDGELVKDEQKEKELLTNSKTNGGISEIQGRLAWLEAENKLLREKIKKLEGMIS